MSNIFNNKNAAITLYLKRTNPTLVQTVKTTLCCALLFFTGVLSGSAQTNSWVQKNDLGYDAINVPETAPHRDAVSFSIGNKGYIGTGVGGLFQQKDFWEYDPIANTWTQKADFGGTARYDAVGFSIGSKGYIGTGYDRNLLYKKDFWEYDPASNIWARKANFAGTARKGAVGFSIGNKGYIGTGISKVATEKDFWEYDPFTNTWTQKADFGGAARRDAVGFSIGSKGYIGTGETYSGDPTNNGTNDFWEYNQTTNSWTQKTNFGGISRGYAVGFSIGTKGYIGTGYDTADNNLKDFWEYNPGTNAWMQKENVGGATRRNAVGFSIGSKGYIGTGWDSSLNEQKDFLEYDQDANNWVQKRDFGGRTAREGAIGFNIGSKGYIGAGNGDDLWKDFWEYDPILNAWTQKADLGTGRNQAVGFSIGSKGYIGTGYNTSYLKDFWEYNPATNTWAQKADFGGAARQDAVGFSIGSKGYIGTGYNTSIGTGYSTPYLKDFWEYNPATNTWAQKADFEGTARMEAVGFSIGNKGYIGTGYDGTYPDDLTKDFWEYNPDADAWNQKADFGGTSRYEAVGFSIRSKGYIGTGFTLGGGDLKDFWEYDAGTNTWIQKADFGGIGRSGAVGFSIDSKGYIGTGINDDYFGFYLKDFWEYSPGNSCPVPANLSVPKIADTAAILKWTLPTGSISSFKIRYRAVGDDTVMKRHKTGSGNHLVLTGLLPNTTYEWQIRSNCATDTTGWICGPDFTTLSSTGFSSDISTINGSKVQGNVSVQIMPNPNKGNFTVQMQLPAKVASITISLYNSLGEKIWQQNAGKLSGSVTRAIALESKLATGVYVLMVQHADVRLMQKVVVAR